MKTLIRKIYTLNIYRDLEMIFRHDPSVQRNVLFLLEILLTYPGLYAVWFYRIAHSLYLARIPIIPKIISTITRFFTGADIHPGTKLLGSILIDHPVGVVIGETAVVGDNTIIYSGAVLGSRKGSMDAGFGRKRHPTVGRNVMVGSGAKILGNIRIGDNVNIGANSVVLIDVPNYSTAVGIPARIIEWKNNSCKKDGKNR